VAPTIDIKIHPPSSTADTGSDCILIRETDAVAAKLEIQATDQPLRVRFPDGQIASSIGISAVALPSTSIALPAHVFADASLQQSLFGISDITNRDYDATFRKDGLYLPVSR
jgi:predicted aspartyl protease